MSRYFPEESECGHHTVFGSTAIRTFAGEHVQLSFVTAPPHGVIDWHSHPNEQTGVVIRGKATFDIGDETKVLGPGEFFTIPGGVRHRVVVLDEAFQAIDAFFPVREEYR